MTLKEEIIQESKRLGIDKIGFTTAEPFDSLKESLEEQKADIAAPSLILNSAVYNSPFFVLSFVNATA